MAETAKEMTGEQIKKKRTVLLALSTFVLLFMGLIYAFSMFAKPMTQDFGLDGQVSLTFNIMMIAFCVGSVVGSMLDRKLGVKPSLLISAVMFAIGFCGTGVLGASGTWVLYVFYGMLGGFGVGVGYNTIVATTNVWFPDKVGVSSGVMMMAFGVSSLVFGNLALVLRPMVGGMGPVLVALGIVVTALEIMLAFMLERPPANIIAVMAPDKLTAGGGAEPGEKDNIFKTPIFYVYYVWAVIVLAIGLAAIGNCASDATLLGVEAGFASFLVGLVSTFNGVARLIIGAIYDRTNLKVAMFADGLVAMLAMVSILAAFLTSTPILYIVGALFCGFGYGGVPVIASAFARQRYGAKAYPLNLSIVNFAITISSLVNILLVAVLGQSNRVGIFTTLAVLGVIGVLDVLVFSRMWNREVESRGVAGTTDAEDELLSAEDEAEAL